MNSPKKKLLIVAYAFPPHSVVGAMRPLRIAKYLQAYSHWIPIIITTNKKFKRVDYSLLEDIPKDIVVHRTHTIEPFNFIIRHRANKLGLAPTHKRTDWDTSFHPTTFKEMHTPLFKRAKLALKDILSTPDPHLFWNFFAIIKGLQVIKKTKIDMILVTIPPWSALISGFVLSALTKIRWIADFRDPWTDIWRGEKTRTREKIELLMEKRLLMDADGIISSSYIFSHDLKKKYPSIDNDKFYTLYNGFDENKFRVVEIPEFDKFTIVHLGSLYSKRKPYGFFRALNEWLGLNPGYRKKVQLVFVGEVDQITLNFIHKLNFNDITRITGFIPHEEAIQICMAADLLLLAMGTGPLTPRGWLPAKVFEYIACKKPILANVIDGEAADLIRTTKSGYVVSSEETDDIMVILDDLYTRKFSVNRRLPWQNDISQIKQLEQCYLMRQLASILRDVNRRNTVHQKMRGFGPLI